jgi:fatty-acid desaturase
MVTAAMLGFHVTWMVNSVTHLWGKQRFSTSDDSRNSLWVALLTGGEGWHNNHHAYPVSARHGYACYEVDLNSYCICILQRLRSCQPRQDCQPEVHRECGDRSARESREPCLSRKHFITKK